MNKLKIFVALFVLSFSFAFLPHEEQVDTDKIIQAIADVYNTNPYVYHEIRYDLKRDLNSSEIHSSEFGLYVKNKAYTFSKIGPVSSLITPKYVLGIDDEDKIVFLTDNLNQQSLEAFSEMSAALESDYTLDHSYEDDFTGILKMTTDIGEIKSLSVYYNRSDFTVKKLVLDYRQRIDLSTDGSNDFEQPVLEISYTNTSFSKTDIPDLQLETYIQKRGDKWSATAQYAGYEFINNLSPAASK